MSDDKIDKAIETTVMDWLQWHTFEEHPDYAQHTLTLISKLKAERDAIRAENEHCKEIAERDGKDYASAIKLIEEMAWALNEVSSYATDYFENMQAEDYVTLTCNKALDQYNKFKKGLKCSN